MKSLVLVAAILGGVTFSVQAKDGPSRRAEKGCTWFEIRDRTLGLAAWTQQCVFGSRRVDFTVQGSSLAIRFSDGGGPEPVIDVFDLLPDEKPETGVRRLFDAKTSKSVASRCVLAPDRSTKARTGVSRFTFVPDAAYEMELKSKQNPNEVPEPPCGAWGASADGIQYFEAQPASGALKVLFVRVGQDTPLFDERTLRLLPAR